MTRHRLRKGNHLEQREAILVPENWLTTQNMQVLQSRLQELTTRHRLSVPALARILHVSPAWVAAILHRLSQSTHTEANTNAQ